MLVRKSSRHRFAHVHKYAQPQRQVGSVHKARKFRNGVPLVSDFHLPWADSSDRPSLAIKDAKGDAYFFDFRGECRLWLDFATYQLVVRKLSRVARAMKKRKPMVFRQVGQPDSRGLPLNSIIPQATEAIRTIRIFSFSPSSPVVGGS